MIVIAGTVRIDADKIDAARSAMVAMVEASRAEPGCVDYAYAADLLDPGLIRVSEVWTDRAALRTHFEMPHMAAWRAAWPALKIRDRDLRLYEAGDPEPV